jgi:hypothetical protein
MFTVRYPSGDLTLGGDLTATGTASFVTMVVSPATTPFSIQFMSGVYTATGIFSLSVPLPFVFNGAGNAGIGSVAFSASSSLPGVDVTFFSADAARSGTLFGLVNGYALFTNDTGPSGKTQPASGTFTLIGKEVSRATVPEPSVVPLLASGMLVLAAHAWRARSPRVG